MTFDEIRSEAELRDLLGMPAGRAVTKERTRLHAVDRSLVTARPVGSPSSSRSSAAPAISV